MSRHKKESIKKIVIDSLCKHLDAENAMENEIAFNTWVALASSIDFFSWLSECVRVFRNGVKLDAGKPSDIVHICEKTYDKNKCQNINL